MVQWYKDKKKVKKIQEGQLPHPSIESANESKDIVNRLKDKIEKEGSDKIRKDILMCNIGH
ncbi:MAG: hypothetical protein Q8P40_00060 [Nitrospirota bacterium]|nr:hypothetical protein [Nitrospirota bacterium]